MAEKSPLEYETTIFTLKSDNIGPNIATLLHARTSTSPSRFYKAILFIHGFMDYFFQDHVCQRFLDHGYDFYALDLRKCGRSIISPDHDRYKHYCVDLHEYDEEITLAIEHIIEQSKNRQRKILLLGHSTGGLITSLYASSGSKHSDIDAVILNSPFLAAPESSALKSALISILMTFAKSFEVDAGWYGRSLHVSHIGEWNFDTNKKPIDKVRIHRSFVSAVERIQKDIIDERIKIKCPILFMCSNRSMYPEKAWRAEYAEADIILNVKTMKQAAGFIGSQITIYEIENAKHDIFLSKQSVRDTAFALMFRWLQHLEEDWMI